jgi:hypothetical protein
VIAVLVAILTVCASTVAARADAASWWAPPLGNQPWQWELDHPLDLHNAQDLGTDDTLPSGAVAPAPVIYDIDGIINPRSTVTALHAMGKRVVCYIEVGAAGNYYSAASEGLRTSYFEQLRRAGDFGKQVSRYPEYYLNIRSPSTVSIIESMIKQQCAAKDFDAVETDIDTEYAAESGFSLTEASEVRYMTTLANYIHRLGMGWWIKNPDDTGDNFATLMYPLADAVLTEQCNQYASCGLLRRYEGHKAVFNAEYALAPSRFCARDDALDFNGAQFNVDLTGVRRPCR